MMTYIEVYRRGVEDDLQHVVSVKGHDLAKASILNGCNRLAKIAKHNHEILLELMSDFFDVFCKEHDLEISKDQLLREYDSWLKTGYLQNTKSSAADNETYRQAISDYKDRLLQRLIPHLQDLGGFAKDSETYLAITDIADDLIRRRDS